MTHLIQFRSPGVFDAQDHDSDHRERVSVPAGTLLEGTVHCYVQDLVEFGDIEIPQGVLLKVPCSYWQFLDAPPPSEEV